MIQQTSINAFMNLSSHYLSKRQELILNYLKVNGSSTDREIAEGLDFLDPNAIRPRRKELCDEGLLSEDCVRCCAITGKMVKSWKVSEVL
jgi:predicted HTH transcriptional regulator